VLTAKSRHKLLHHQPGNRAAVGAYEQSLAGAVAQDCDPQAFTRGASGGGLARLRLIALDCSFMFKAAGFLCVELEGAAAVGANMVEAALGLAGVDDFPAATLRTAHDFFESRHTGILAIAARDCGAYVYPIAAKGSLRSS